MPDADTSHGGFRPEIRCPCWAARSILGWSGDAEVPRVKRSRVAGPLPKKSDRANPFWFGDIASVPTWMGFVYVALGTDVFSRRIFGWRE
jgi:hypothetical protein